MQTIALKIQPCLFNHGKKTFQTLKHLNYMWNKRLFHYFFRETFEKTNIFSISSVCVFSFLDYLICISTLKLNSSKGTAREGFGVGTFCVWGERFFERQLTTAQTLRADKLKTTNINASGELE